MDMEQFPKAEKLSIVTFGGGEYIGVLTETELQCAFEYVSDVNDNGLYRYISRLNANETIELKFNGVQVIARSLKFPEASEYEALLVQMANAKKRGMSLWENKCFGDMVR